MEGGDHNLQIEQLLRRCNRMQFSKRFQSLEEQKVIELRPTTSCGCSHDTVRPASIVGSSLSLRGLSPDSTCRVNPKSQKHSDKEELTVLRSLEKGASVSPSVGLDLDTSVDEGSETQKLRLSKRSGKRKRYSEETSPEMKRTKANSSEQPNMETDADVDIQDERMDKPSRTKTNQNDIDVDVSIKEQGKSAQNYNTAKPMEKHVIGNSDKQGNSGKETKKHILVQDTCNSVDNDSAEKLKGNVKSQKSNRKKIKDKLIDETIMCIPETLAVEYDDDFDVEEEEIVDEMDKFGRQKFHPEMSNIAEASVEDSQIDDQNKIKADDQIQDKVDGKAYLGSQSRFRDNDDSNSSVGSNSSHAGKSKGKKNGTRGRRKSKDDISSDTLSQNTGKVFDLKSMLMSPDECNDKTDRDCSKKTSDDEIDIHITSSQKFGGNRNKGIKSRNEEKKDSRLFGSVSNVCRSMKEVDALFETPDKGDMTIIEESDTEQNRRAKSKNLGNVLEDDVVLRRSPRKHKSSLSVERASPRKSKQVLKFCGNVSSQAETVGGYTVDENDLTIAPEPSEQSDAVNETTGRDMTSNSQSQSVDFYNIVPVTNGILNNSKKFQVRACRKKSKKTGLGGTKKIDLEETFKSPSIISTVPSFKQRGKDALAKETDVILVGSPSVSSVESDCDSPLLLRTNRAASPSPSVEIVDTNNGCDETPPRWKSGRKTTRSGSQSSISSRSDEGAKVTRGQNRGQKKRLNGNSSVSFEQLNEKDKNEKSKNFLQTTLTQGFFSPKKKKSQKDIDDENLKLAMQLSLKESQGNDVINLDNETDVEIMSPFKKPVGEPRKESLTRKKSKSKQQKTEVGNESDVLQRADTKEKYKVLKELQNRKDKDLPHELEQARVTGSLEDEGLVRISQGDGTFRREGLNDFNEADLASSSESLPRTSTMVPEYTQDIPYIENVDPDPVKSSKTLHVNLDDSFDRRPKKKTSGTEQEVAHVAVVRKRDERQKLQGHDCKQCTEYYKAAGLSDAEMKEHMNKCSRHRAKYAPPDTPPHFWSVDFIETQDCPNTEKIEPDNDAPTYRRRRRLNKFFKGKNENSTVIPDDDSQDLDFG
ncbi:CTIP-like protein [Mya arenaria]|uniref:CTIP-like protein n=1 Tax=Mya arenaria TaxID=6604 RepID=A0ABY7F8S0_MYAAR|nr:CTIP-like protein [Mya arenaria]